MKILLISLYLIITTGILAQEPDSSSALFKMREAERSFAKSAAMNGRKAAFADFLAERSVIFTDKWITSGKQFWQKRQPSPVILKWEPEYMHISRGRNYGISTGPFEAQEYRPNTPVLSTGYFLSVWEIQKDGSWKVILDAGITSPKPSGPLHRFNFPAGDDRVSDRINADTSSSGLIQVEEKMLSSWRNNSARGTYTSYLSSHARLMRNGHLPATETDSINVLAGMYNERLEWKREGYNICPSGDMGFTYGNATIGGEAKGFYVRIWEKEPGDKWKIIIDLVSID